MGQSADKAIEISKIYRNCAGALAERARVMRDAGEITPAQYDIVFRRYLQIVQHAVNILDEASHLEVSGIADEVVALEDASKRLKKAFENVNKVREVVEISLSLVLAAGTVAIAVVDPTKASVVAATGTVLTTVETILKYAESE